MPRRKDNEIYEYKLKSGKTKYGFKTYVGINKETGKPVKVTRQGFSTRKEAEQAKTVIKADGQKNTAIKRKNALSSKTVKEVYDIWLPIYRMSVKPSTINRTESIWKNTIGPEFSNDYINHIDPDHLQRFANDLASRLVQFKRHLNLLDRLIKYAIVRNWCDYNPFAKVIIPQESQKSGKDNEHNFYELKDLKEFLSAAKEYNFQYYTFFMILSSLGLRRGEALELKWKDIDFNKKTLSINRTTTVNEDGTKAIGSPKTESSIRTLLLPDNLANVLAKYKSSQNEFNSSSDFLFHTRTDEFLTDSTIGYWMRAIYKKNPTLKRITPHGLRHTLATLLYDDPDINITPKDVQTILGHKNPDMALKIYTHSTKRRKQKVNKTINNLDL